MWASTLDSARTYPSVDTSAHTGSMPQKGWETRFFFFRGGLRERALILHGASAAALKCIESIAPRTRRVERKSALALCASVRAQIARAGEALPSRHEVIRSEDAADEVVAVSLHSRQSDVGRRFGELAVEPHRDVI